MKSIESTIHKIESRMFEPKVPDVVESNGFEEDLKIYVAELTKKKFVTNYLTLAMMNGVLDTKETYTLAQKASTSDGLTSLYVHLLQKISEIPVESEVIRKVDILIRNKH